MRIKHIRKVVAPKLYLKAKYKKRFDRKLNLENPRRYREIMQWRKLYDKNPLYVQCSDKLAVRDYIKDMVGDDILVPLICSGRTWDDIDFQSLPESFVIKATHGSGWYEVVHEKSEVDESKLRDICEKWLMQNYYYGLMEWQYKDIPPRLVVETLLQDENGKVPADYKCHCFRIGGKIEVVISVDQDRFSDHKRSMYDIDWNRLPFTIKIPEPEQDFPCPDNLADIVGKAMALADPFNYVRVDLYSLNGNVYFGELTFNPSSGLQRFYPDEWDFIFGEKLIKAGVLDVNRR